MAAEADGLRETEVEGDRLSDTLSDTEGDLDSEADSETLGLLDSLTEGLRLSLTEELRDKDRLSLIDAEDDGDWEDDGDRLSLNEVDRLMDLDSDTLTLLEGL